VKTIQKVNNNFYGTLKANIMSHPDYNALMGSGKKVSGYQNSKNYSSPVLIDPSILVPNMSFDTRKSSHK